MCTTTYHAIIDLSYVPTRIDTTLVEDEMKASMEAWAEFKGKKETTFYVGGIGTAFGGIPGNILNGFHPIRVESTGYMGIRNKVFDLYFRHSSDHPIANGYHFTEIEDESGNVIMYNLDEYDYLEEIGLKIRINSK